MVNRRRRLKAVASTPPVRVRKSRVVFLDGGQNRDHADRSRTILPGELPSMELAGFQHAFHTHYAAIRRFCLERDLGVALVAVHVDGELGGRAWVGARLGEIQTAIIGRHPSVDLFLQNDAVLSNRHLAMVIEPLTSWEPDQLRFRLLDLRTGAAMWTEKGERVEAIVAEGPAFVRVGAYRVMAFQTGSRDSWPESARDAWEMLPERIFVDEREAEPDAVQRWSMKQSARGKITLLPAALGANDPRGGHPLGTLTIRSRRGAIERTITVAEAKRGVLLGREPRCDFSGLLAHMQVSRVHLLIAQIGGRTWVVDTGSLAGLREDGELVRAVELDRARELTMGMDLVGLRWTPFVLH